MVRGEHHSDAGQHAVEGAVLERQRLGVGDLPRDVEPAQLREPTPRVEELRREVARGGARSRGGRGQGGVARSGGDVEHPVTDADTRRVDERGTEAGDHLARDGRVVAERPHRAVPSLERCVGPLRRVEHLRAGPALPRSVACGRLGGGVPGHVVLLLEVVRTPSSSIRDASRLQCGI